MVRSSAAGVRAAKAALKATPPRAKRFINRELSWLEFDQRVLEAAADPGLPLLERVKLCGIVASNLDEFFAVRMAGLRGQVLTPSLAQVSLDGMPPARAQSDARRRIQELEAEQAALWRETLRPALAAEGILIAAVEECTSRELRSLTKRFGSEIQPLLTPIAIGPPAPFPYVQSLALNLGALVRDDGESRFVRINVPPDLPRFIEVGTRGVRVPLEDAISHFLPTVVGGTIEATGVFRITRDADFLVAQGADDLLGAVEAQLLQRRFGDVVRLEVAADGPASLVDVLERELAIDPRQTYVKDAPLGLAALAELAGVDRPDLKHKPWRPVTRRPFAHQAPAQLLAQIGRRDILVHHPYDAFDTSVEAFAAAAHDPKVAALKASVYRAGDTSPTLASLVAAAEEDKHAVCVVELTARFDERRNIQWSRLLEGAGVDVVYGMPNMKMHAKLTLLVRQERNGARRYVHIGTGNYHSSNASTYEDLGLFTADEEIAADVADVFNAVTSLTRPAAFRKLLVGPWFLRDGIVDEIQRVAGAAGDGRAARIRIKVNSLVDPEIIDALCAASTAGATVEIVTRGICVLRPGVPGLSERITVRSVLGRFLEHSRIMSFQAGDQVTTWIGSADLMPRNLDRRVEVLAPVEDSRLRAELALVFDALFADTQLSWELDAEGTWTRVPAQGAKRVSAQETLMARATKRAKKRR